MNSNGYRLRLGLFVLLSFGLLTGMILLFGGSPVRFRETNPYTIRFSDAPGVNVGTPVRRSGIRIGEVSKIDLDPETGKVYAQVLLESKYLPRTGDEPTVVRGLLVNDTSIDLIPLRPDQVGTPLPIGSELVGISNSSNPVAAVQDLMPEVQKSLEQIRRSMAKLEEIVPQMNRTLEDFSLLAKDTRTLIPELKKSSDSFQEALALAKNTIPEFTKSNKAIQDAAADAQKMINSGRTWIEDTNNLIKKNEPKVVKVLDNAANTLDSLGQLFNDENRKNASEMLKNLNDASKSLERTASSTEDFFKDIRKTMTKVNETLTNADLAVTDLRGTIKPISDKMGQVMENIDVASKQLALTLSDTRQLLKAVSRADGTVAKFLNDPAFYDNLNQASILFMRVMPRLDRIFRDLEVFSDKIARHPESIGLGGAIRPSAGLKESPIPAASFGPLQPRLP
ncbi:MCE family protein [Telmatocola sphagniphila]|uniref:MCE family protein n=1 Tax=Telmatocola sphagniphila TaxID=1123043 RepID=A0A8E6EVP3_9BACT|nr:MlaD family protein [Telmatocola sphagniphila]QVL32872.1 MCE family protein [Telmatocola sphagniphila]